MYFKLLLVSVLSLNLFADEKGNKIVYGDDNRIDIKDLKDTRIKKFSHSIAGRVGKFSFSYLSQSKFLSLNSVPLLSSSYGMNVCSDERFSQQPTAVDCTGFLISTKHLVTAGHCMVDAGTHVVDKVTDQCSMYVWMFDYHLNSNGVFNLSQIPKKNIYNCKKVIAGVFNNVEDFALIELESEVLDRPVLMLNTETLPVKNQKIYVMGHPTGLPLKFANKAKVFRSNKNFFVTNLDTFGGNSGSPVFNEKSNLVEGILVRGDTDYYEVTLDNGKKCSRVNFCDNDRENCKEDDPNIKGEHVTLINKIFPYLEMFSK